MSWYTGVKKPFKNFILDEKHVLTSGGYVPHCSVVISECRFIGDYFLFSYPSFLISMNMYCVLLVIKKILRCYMSIKIKDY